MKSFTNFKRDIRTFYKPKGKNSRRDNDQDIGNDTTGAQCADPGIQLALRPSTAAGPDEVQAILTEELKKHQLQGEGITNPLFDMDGKIFSVHH